MIVAAYRCVLENTRGQNGSNRAGLSDSFIDLGPAAQCAPQSGFHPYAALHSLVFGFADLLRRSADLVGPATGEYPIAVSFAEGHIGR